VITMRQDATKSSRNAPRKRLSGVIDRRQRAKQEKPYSVKFKVEPMPLPDLPLGNRACCCKIGR